ncbi:MAG: ATP-dependent RecD-like DNA helicase [Puniceicoccales bacterium]|nr:ATP-dependent RecD-like DNA helicase [Puniceicoccales bacterium]
MEPCENINAVLERFLFRNEESFFSIVELTHLAYKKSFTARGNLPGVNCGETLVLTGYWDEHSKYGRQFLIQSFRSSLPADVQGIRKYLGSGLIDGIGKVYADKIVNKFGAKTFEIISSESARLREVPGIGPMRAKNIKNSWDEQVSIRDILIFLQTYGVSNSLCLRLYKIYGDRAKHILETDPYRVANEVPGIGFKTADKIAMNLGMPSNHHSRIEAGICFCFNNFETVGHTCVSREMLLKSARILLEVPEPKVDDQLKFLIQIGSISVTKDDLLQLPAMKIAEETIANGLGKIFKSKAKSLPNIDVEKAILWAQNREGFVFAKKQVDALKMALTSKLSIITGGPGTGKTTILRALVEILGTKNAKVLLASPTGRAAQRLGEMTGMPAKTIHRLLQFVPDGHRFLHDENTPLAADFVVIDEASMLDTKLAAALFRALDSQTSLLLVGDVDQLPSVGAGNVLWDCIDSNIFSVTRLKNVFRQDNRSDIVSIAHDIISGNQALPRLICDPNLVDKDKDFNFIVADGPDDCLNKVEMLCKDLLPKWYGIDPIDDIQVLVPLHRGTVGVTNFNEVLQRSFSHGASKTHWNNFRLGDKVIQLRNNYDKNIFNGDLGRIISVDTVEGIMTVDFNGENVELKRSDLGDIALAYAITIHKAQGSEFPMVILPLMNQHYIMLQRNLIYTAVTRGRNKVFIVGDPKAYYLAIKNNKSTERITGLKHLLK